MAEELQWLENTGTAKKKEDHSSTDLCLKTSRGQLEPEWRLISPHGNP